MKLTKLTGCIMLINKHNESLCLSNNSLPLYTQVYICVHLSNVPHTASLFPTRKFPIHKSQWCKFHPTVRQSLHKYQLANGRYYHKRGTDHVQLLFCMNYVRDDIVNMNGCTSRYSHILLKTGGEKLQRK